MISPDISCKNPWAVSGLIHAAIAPVMVSLITLTAIAIGIADKNRIHFFSLPKGTKNAKAPVKASREVSDRIPEHASITSRDVFDK